MGASTKNYKSQNIRKSPYAAEFHLFWFVQTALCHGMPKSTVVLNLVVISTHWRIVRSSSSKGCASPLVLRAAVRLVTLSSDLSGPTYPARLVSKQANGRLASPMSPEAGLSSTVKDWIFISSWWPILPVIMLLVVAAFIVAFVLLLYMISPLISPKPLKLNGAHVVVSAP